MADAEGDVLRGLRKFIKKNIYIYITQIIFITLMLSDLDKCLNTDTHKRMHKQ